MDKIGSIVLFAENTPQNEKIIIIALLVFIVISVIYLLSKVATELILNSVLGFTLVWLLKIFGFWKFQFSLLVYLLILFGGVPGVILIYILNALGVQF
ncbi:MAG: hypothetical protein Fur0024_3370 [Patescibacteria group bacterium]